MAKAFSELSEREILALAISLEEDDARIFGDYTDRLRAEYPDTAKLLKIMQDEELVHAQRLIASYRAQFGEHIPFVQRQDVKGFLRRKPLWLAKMLSVQQVRKEIEVMEADSLRFYHTAAKRTTNLSVRQLLDELAAAKQAHEDLAGKLKTDLEESGARKREDQTHRRTFVLQVIQPGLAGLMGGSVSTLAPVFAAAFATRNSWDAFLVGMAAMASHIALFGCIAKLVSGKRNHAIGADHR